MVEEDEADEQDEEDGDHRLNGGKISAGVLEVFEFFHS